MASGTVRSTITAAVVWLVIGANRIIRTNSYAIQCALEDSCKSRNCCDQAAERTLCSSARRINEDAATIYIPGTFLT